MSTDRRVALSLSGMSGYGHGGGGWGWRSWLALFLLCDQDRLWVIGKRAGSGG